jgi:hypothetical protein
MMWTALNSLRIEKTGEKNEHSNEIPGSIEPGMSSPDEKPAVVKYEPCCMVSVTREFSPQKGS